MEHCIVKVESENEVTKVVDICYKNGVEWRSRTKDYMPFDFKKDKECYLFVQNTIIYDINAKSYAICKSKRDKQNIYSAKEFIRKFGESKYRIKTKEEFIEEFGKNWRYHVNLTFTPGMDELFGIKLTNDEYIELEQKGNCYIRPWFISKDMITEVDKPINRRDKTRLFETITKPFRLEKEKFKLSDSLFKRKKPKLNQDN